MTKALLRILWHLHELSSPEVKIILECNGNQLHLHGINLSITLVYLL